MSSARPEVRRFIDLGPLPSVNDVDLDVDLDVVQRHQDLLEAIEPPVTLEEARLLVDVFGEGDCFGLAWSLLHLIETAGADVIGSEPDVADEWCRRIWDAAQAFRDSSG